ncbi:MAG TPA: hypothetical protein VGM78_09595, partial [Ilumatobacteraceae bacterium]
DGTTSVGQLADLVRAARQGLTVGALLGADILDASALGGAQGAALPPLTLPTIAPDAACPVTTAFSSPSKDLGVMAGTGVARPVGLNPDGPLDASGMADSQSDGWGGAKIVWALKDGAGVALVRGRQLDGGGAIGFNEATTRVRAILLQSSSAASLTKGAANVQLLDGGWYGIVTAAWFSAAPGCYGFQIDSAAGTSTVIFDVT